MVNEVRKYLCKPYFVLLITECLLLLLLLCIYLIYIIYLLLNLYFIYLLIYYLFFLLFYFVPQHFKDVFSSPLKPPCQRRHCTSRSSSFSPSFSSATLALTLAFSFQSSATIAYVSCKPTQGDLKGDPILFDRSQLQLQVAVAQVATCCVNKSLLGICEMH